MIIKFCISIFISIICLYFATRNVHWGELKILLADAAMWPLFAGFLISLSTFGLRALRWRILLEPFQKIPLFTLLRWQIGGLFVNNLFPLRMGDFARAYWAGHKSSISKSSVLATVIIERLWDVGSIAIISVLLLIFMGLYKQSYITQDHLLALLLLFLAVLLLIYSFSKRYTYEKIFHKLKEILPERLFTMLEKFLTGLKILKDKKEVLKITSLSPVIWCIDIFILALISKSLNLDLSWTESGLVMTGLILGIMIPAAPGAAGTYEAGGVAALTLLGIDKTLALSFVLLLHAFQFLTIVTLGLPVIIAEGFNPKLIFNLLKNKNADITTEEDLK